MENNTRQPGQMPQTAPPTERPERNMTAHAVEGWLVDVNDPTFVLRERREPVPAPAPVLVATPVPKVLRRPEPARLTPSAQTYMDAHQHAQPAVLQSAPIAARRAESVEPELSLPWNPAASTTSAAASPTEADTALADRKRAAKRRHRVIASGLAVAIAAGGYSLRNDIPGLTSSPAEASTGPAGATALQDVTGSSLTKTVLIDTLAVTANAQVNIAINTSTSGALPFSQKPHVALSTNAKPNAVMNTTVGLYPIIEGDPTTPFAVAKGNSFVVDRSMIGFSPLFASQTCASNALPQPACVDNFGAAGTMPSGDTKRGTITTDESTAIDQILQTGGPNFAAYNTGIEHQLEDVVLQKIGTSCIDAVQSDTDTAIKSMLQSIAASEGVTLKGKNGGITFKDGSVYGNTTIKATSLSSDFEKANPDAVANITTTDTNVTRYALVPDGMTSTCAVQPQTPTTSEATPPAEASVPATPPAAGATTSPAASSAPTTPVTGASQ